MKGQILKDQYKKFVSAAIMVLAILSLASCSGAKCEDIIPSEEPVEELSGSAETDGEGLVELSAVTEISDGSAEAEKTDEREAAGEMETETTLSTETEPEASAETENEPETDAETEQETEPETEPEEIIIPQKDEIVRVADYIPDIYVDLRYATDNNFTGTVIYDFSDAYLRYGTIEKLAAVQEQVKQDGYSLKIWDAFRPVSAQFTLWEVYPNSTYVANPNRGYSAHSKGNTVDITLVMADGTEIPMPTDFDDFSAKADRDYSDCSEEEAANARYLENVMKENGFTPYSAEWWHFSDNDSYDVAKDIEIPPDRE